jgi:acyl carrier protein
MADYRTWLIDWFKQRQPELTLADEDNYFEAGAIDSLGVIELIEDIENAFQLRFSAEDFQDRRFPSIAGLVQLLSEKQAA